MTEWLRLGDIQALSPTQGQPDVVLGVVVSPYDVPDAVRGFRTEAGRFRIEFRYIDGEEQGTQIKLGQHIVATEGKYSGRLLAMDIDIQSLGANSVGLSIEMGPQQPPVKRTLDSAWEAVARSFGERSQERQAIAATARRAAATREKDLLGQLTGQ